MQACSKASDEATAAKQPATSPISDKITPFEFGRYFQAFFHAFYNPLRALYNPLREL